MWTKVDEWHYKNSDGKHAISVYGNEDGVANIVESPDRGFSHALWIAQVGFKPAVNLGFFHSFDEAVSAYDALHPYQPRVSKLNHSEMFGASAP